MRTISAAAITAAVARLCIRANTVLPEDVIDHMEIRDSWPGFGRPGPWPRRP